MSADLIDRLISDIVAVTEKLIESDPVDLTLLQTGPTSLERSHGGEKRRNNGQKHKHPMSRGIHKGVC